MNKILAVLKREYLTRVKKKSFVIFTILGPVLMALLMGLPSVMMMLSPSVQQQLALVDLHGGFAGPLEEALSESTRQPVKSCARASRRQLASRTAGVRTSCMNRSAMVVMVATTESYPET